MITIGNNDGCMWVIAKSVFRNVGVKVQNWEKSGKRMSSHDVQIFSPSPPKSLESVWIGFDKTDELKVLRHNERNIFNEIRTQIFKS